MDNERRETHPSYGKVQFNRISGGDFNLFGSSVLHNNTISLTICRAEKVSDLYSERYYAREELIEVRLSPAQYAELLTTMNCGSGVPCTIEHVAMKRMPPCPEVHKRQQLQDDFKERMRSESERLRTFAERCNELLSKPSTTKAQREELKREIEHFVTEMRSNIPFAHECFNEAVEKTITEGKAELDAAVTSTIQRIGLERLTESLGSAEVKVPCLESDK